ncbi:MAG TPA: helix-hairpin-helix domain-containing protein, partial [Bacteroidaceae bacterium]|nr:helix-hairpin-helix domain-containing protein [Bacteroidaceae bacterium]
MPHISAQENTQKSLFLEELYENDLLDEQQYENWEDSTFILPQRINLNTVDAHTLHTLPFLSERQINDIIMTRDLQGNYTSITDLRLIPCISPHIYTLLKQYCTIEQKGTHKITWHQIRQKSKHQIISQINLPLYKRQGYLYTSQKNKSPFYLGDPWSHYIRYDGHYRKQIYWGFTLAQGAGEPFFVAHQNRYDYIGYYFLLQDIGKIHQLALGKYNVHFGLGLIINQNLLLGKGAGLEAKQTLKPLFSKHSSKSESNYFEGVATDLEVAHKIHLAAFASYRHL